MPSAIRKQLIMDIVSRAYADASLYSHSHGGPQTAVPAARSLLGQLPTPAADTLRDEANTLGRFLECLSRDFSRMAHFAYQAGGMNREAEPAADTQEITVTEVIDADGDSPLCCDHPDFDGALPDELAECLRDRAVVTHAAVFHPRTDRYGTPTEATDDGCREHLWAFGWMISPALEVSSECTGDDSMPHVQMRLAVPPDLAARVANFISSGHTPVLD
jgi:hypothetical protein